MTVDDLQIPLFDIKSSRPPKVRTPASNERPHWSKHQPKSPERCDDCVALLATTAEAPRARQAKFKRATPGTDLLLCYAHAQDRRLADHLSPLKGD